MRPTTFLLRVQPYEPWEEYDFLLHEAYCILQDERCSQCGMPRYICHNDSADLEFDIIEDDCRVMVVKDEHEENERKAGGENYKPPVGTTLRPKPYLVSGGDPATLRDSYYDGELAKRRALEAEAADVASDED